VLARGARGTAIAHVALVGGEQASVYLSLNGDSRIAGRVVFEGDTPAPSLGSVRVRAAFAGPEGLTPTGPSSSYERIFFGQPTVVKPDGTFEIVGALSTVTLRTVEPVPGWTLHAVMADGRDLLEEPLELKGGEQVTNVELRFTDQIAELSGTTVDASGGPTAGCVVAVFPDNRERPASFHRMRLERADQKGRFTIANLPAGSYRLVAVPQLDAAYWMSMDSLDRLHQDAISTPVAAREKKETRLPCLNVQ
jgi:hypothetical protein